MQPGQKSTALLAREKLVECSDGVPFSYMLLFVPNLSNVAHNPTFPGSSQPDQKLPDSTYRRAVVPVDNIETAVGPQVHADRRKAHASLHLLGKPSDDLNAGRALIAARPHAVK
jgi:hypothetical protein